MVKLFKVDRQARQVRSFRPFSPTHGHIIHDLVELNFIYNTVSSHRRLFTIKETNLYLFSGLTSANKPAADYQILANHKKAFEFIEERIRQGSYAVDLNFVAEVASILMQNYSLELVDGMTPEKQTELGLLLNWVTDKKDQLHPIVIAAHLEAEITRLKPYWRLSGRVARLISAFILMQNDLPAVAVAPEKRRAYDAALESAQAGQLEELILLIKAEVLGQLDQILKILCGRENRLTQSKHPLYWHRRERKLTLDALAKLAGVSPSKISRIENKQGEADTETILALSGALNISPTSLARHLGETA